METVSIAPDREARDLLRGRQWAGESFGRVVKCPAGSHCPLSILVRAGKNIPEQTGRGIPSERSRRRELDPPRFERFLRSTRRGVRALDPSFLFDVLRGHRGTATEAAAPDAEGPIRTILAPVLAESLDGACFAGGVTLAQAARAIAGCAVVPFDQEGGPIAEPLRAELCRQRGRSPDRRHGCLGRSPSA